MTLAHWKRREEEQRIVYADLAAIDARGLHRQCVIVRAQGLWVRLDELRVHTLVELERFQALLVDAWYEAADLAASHRHASERPQPTGHRLQCLPIGRQLLLRTSGTEFRAARELRAIFSELREWGNECWPLLNEFAP